jgi:hypothetical protein
VIGVLQLQTLPSGRRNTRNPNFYTGCLYFCGFIRGFSDAVFLFTEDVHVVFDRSRECFCQRCVGTCPLEYNIEAHLIRMKLNLTYREFIEKRHVRTAACIPDAHGAIPLQTCIRGTRIIGVKSACCRLSTS